VTHNFLFLLLLFPLSLSCSVCWYEPKQELTSGLFLTKQGARLHLIVHCPSPTNRY
jgi:hypothetical protein